MPPHHTITSLTITSGTHFQSLTLSFLDALNTIIGGRGTGKTGALSLLRFALGSPIPAHYAADFDACIKGTLGAGRVAVTVRTRHGVSYTSTRSYGEPPRVTNADGELVSAPLAGGIFTIDAYARGELERTASTPQAQLALLDKFAPSDVRRVGAAIEAAERKLAQNAAEVAQLDAEIEVDECQEAELPSITEALQGLALPEGSDGGETARAQARKVERGREQRGMTEIARELAATRVALGAFAGEALRRLGAAVEADLERGPGGGSFQRAHEAVRAAAGALEAAVGRLHAEIARAETIVATESRGLAALHHKEDEAYQALVVRQDADRKRAAEREHLHRRFEELSALAKRMGERRRRRDTKVQERASLFAERAALIRERVATRRRVADEITAALGGKVSVSLVGGADQAAYRALLADLLRGTNVRPVEIIEEIAAGIQPEELVAAAVRNDTAAIEAVDGAKTGKPARAQKILAALRASGRLAELETVPLGDVPLIQLRTDKGLEPSTQLSTGQKCVCILSILLLESASPLIIDQVEDDLDNKYIYEVLVKSLEIVKTGRQLILVSHNPNISVLADSERVIALETEGGHGVVLAFGTVDEMREHIERILEGGREAFLRRGARYGHTPRGDKERS